MNNEDCLETALNAQAAQEAAATRVEIGDPASSIFVIRERMRHTIGPAIAR